MELREELKAAARHLGQSLHQDEHVRAYLDAQQAAQADPEASGLEKKMYDVYHQLIARQQVGEGLTQVNTRAFCDIRQEVQNLPPIAKRNDALRLLKPFLAQVAEEISFILGVDYAALAKPQ